MCGTYGNVCIKKSENTQEGTKMTRFARELSGSLGTYRKASAEKELEQIREDFETGKITVDENGVARNRIGRILMSDLLEKLTYITDKVDVEATKAAREAETDAFLESYRKANHRRSNEELNEMRATFGTGTTVVDIITGERIRL